MMEYFGFPHLPYTSRLYFLSDLQPISLEVTSGKGLDMSCGGASSGGSFSSSWSDAEATEWVGFLWVSMGFVTCALGGLVFSLWSRFALSSITSFLSWKWMLRDEKMLTNQRQLAYQSQLCNKQLEPKYSTISILTSLMWKFSHL